MNFLYGTPWWAYSTYLLITGIRAIKSKSVWVPKLFIIPAVLIAIKFFFKANWLMIANYFLWLGGRVVLSFILNTKIKVNRQAKLIQILGSYKTFAYFCIYG